MVKMGLPYSWNIKFSIAMVIYDLRFTIYAIMGLSGISAVRCDVFVERFAPRPPFPELR
jgi:hypothetical protein